MRVVANSSPLIVLAKIGQFLVLQHLFGVLTISEDVYQEVVIDGADQPGADEVANSSWVTVRKLRKPAALHRAQRKLGLGIGELSTILLAKQQRADLILLDDLGARKLARRQGLRVQGSVGVLESAFVNGHVADLRKAYEMLIAEGVYLERDILNSSLQSLGLPQL